MRAATANILTSNRHDVRLRIAKFRVQTHVVRGRAIQGGSVIAEGRTFVVNNLERATCDGRTSSKNVCDGV